VFPDFVHHRVGNASIWLDRQFADPVFIERLADADQWLRDPTCQIIKDQKKIKVGRLNVAVAGIVRSVYVKRYNAFSLRYKITSPFIRSGALRALRGAAILRQANIATAVPVAAVEHRFGGVLSKSFFISEEIARGKTIDAYWREHLRVLPGREGFKRRRNFLISLAWMFRTLHAQNIYHNDLKDANILAVANAFESESLALLDLEGIRECSLLSDKRRTKNLVQLHRTLGRNLRWTDKAVFLKSYLDVSFVDGRVKRRLVENVLRESRRVDLLKSFSAADNDVLEKPSRA
jgi:serine/threonine protein kinase